MRLRRTDARAVLPPPDAYPSTYCNCAGLVAAAAPIEAALKGALNGGDDTAILAGDRACPAREAAECQIGRSEPARMPSSTAVRVLRVDTARIDALVNLTGELTVVKNALGHLAALAQGGIGLQSARCEPA